MSQRPRIGLLLAGMLFLAPSLFGQGKASVFFPTDEQLETLADELEELLEEGRSAAVRNRFIDFLDALLARPERGPLTLAPSYATSPWHFLARLWPRLPEDSRDDARTRFLEKLRPRGDPVGTVEVRALQERVFQNIPDRALRQRLGPELAERFLEQGRFARAESFLPCFEPAHETRSRCRGYWAERPRPSSVALLPEPKSRFRSFPVPLRTTKPPSCFSAFVRRNRAPIEECSVPGRGCRQIESPCPDRSATVSPSPRRCLSYGGTRRRLTYTSLWSSAPRPTPSTGGRSSRSI